MKTLVWIHDSTNKSIMSHINALCDYYCDKDFIIVTRTEHSKKIFANSYPNMNVISIQKYVNEVKHEIFASNFNEAENLIKT